MKSLIVGLGNIGDEYANSRHNIGFIILDALAKSIKASFTQASHAYITKKIIKGHTFVLAKPTTYVNLSGKAVNYWMQKEKIAPENVLVIVDDLSLPFGKLRLRAKGSDAGHNGLKNINETLGTHNYPRLRFGIGHNFSKGQQVNYVLGSWSEEEKENLEKRISAAIDLINSFGLEGLQKTMSLFNN